MQSRAGEEALTLVNKETESLISDEVLLSGCELSETDIVSATEVVADKAYDAFQTVRGILNPEERAGEDKKVRAATALDLFSKLGMLSGNQETLDKFKSQYYDAEAAQESLDAIRRAELLNKYEDDPAHRGIDALGSRMGQQDVTVVKLRRTILVLLEANHVPPTIPRQ